MFPPLQNLGKEKLMERKENGITIEVPYLPTTLNQVLRMHKMERDRYFTKCKNDVWILAHEKGRIRPKRPYQKAKIIMTFIFPDKGVRDFDNYIGGAKGITDGIKAAKIIQDDCWQKLKVEFRGEVGKPPRTIIEVQEIR